MNNDPPVRAPGPARIRIVLIEDHAILRAGMRLLIEMEGDLKVVGEATCAAEGIQAVRSLEPTLVICDLSLPDTSGLHAISALRALSQQLLVLVLTGYCTDEYIRAALNAGADGYVLKDASRAELMRAIRALIGGQKYFSAPVSARLVSGYLQRGEPTANVCQRITEREGELLVRIALGDSNKGAARFMHLSVKTVEKHRANLMRKLELHNTAAVTLFAVRNGLVPNGPPREQAVPTCGAGAVRPLC